MNASDTCSHVLHLILMQTRWPAEEVGCRLGGGVAGYLAATCGIRGAVRISGRTDVDILIALSDGTPD